jgi:hypothetical protein
MLEFLFRIIADAFLDTLKLLPFLFLTYLIMEWLEHKTGSRTQAVIRKAGRMGPLFGSVLGVFPQCGFSTAAANLYSGGVITAGTLAAVFLSTSDEMLPIFISESVSIKTILTILGIKVVLAMLSGFLLDFLYHNLIRKEIRYKNIHSMCESEHCKCEEGIFSSSVRHTLHIALFIFLISVLFNGAIELVGEDALRTLTVDVPVVGELVAGIVGMIPNCAASVVITELYIEGVIGFGPMMTGLLAGAGVGALVLCRINKKHPKQNVGILLFVYLISVFYGVIIDML